MECWHSRSSIPKSNIVRVPINLGIQCGTHNGVKPSSAKQYKCTITQEWISHCTQSQLSPGISLKICSSLRQIKPQMHVRWTNREPSANTHLKCGMANCKSSPDNHRFHLSLPHPLIIVTVCEVCLELQIFVNSVQFWRASGLKTLFLCAYLRFTEPDLSLYCTLMQHMVHTHCKRCTCTSSNNITFSTQRFWVWRWSEGGPTHETHKETNQTSCSQTGATVLPVAAFNQI